MIYAKPGDSFQQFGGQCPEGWIQMVGPRPDGDGWIAGEDGEWFIPAPPQPSLAEELKQAQDDLNIALNDLNQKWLSATISGGVTEAKKKAAIESQMAKRREEHAAKVQEIKDRHGA